MKYVVDRTLNLLCAVMGEDRTEQTCSPSIHDFLLNLLKDYLALLLVGGFEGLGITADFPGTCNCLGIRVSGLFSHTLFRGKTLSAQPAANCVLVSG
jgi:hypothetical protein